MRRLRFLALLAAASAALTLVGSAWASPADNTIGQTGGTILCGLDLTMVQSSVVTGTDYVLPSGDWTISSWSTQAGAGGGTMALVVFRLQSGNTYTVVGVSSSQSLTPSSLNTFSTSIDAQGGDRIGMWATAPTSCGGVAAASDTISGATMASAPAAGTSASLSLAQANRLLNISATYVSSCPVTPVGCYYTQPRQGYCTKEGKFLDLVRDQASWDPAARAKVAYSAVFVKGIGATCDAGRATKTTSKVNGSGLDRGPSDPERVYDLYQ